MRSYTVERYLKTGNYTQTIGDFQSRFDPPKPLYKSLAVQASWDTWGPQANNPMSENSFWEEEDPVRGAVEQVRESVEKSPGRSSRRKCQELD